MNFESGSVDRKPVLHDPAFAAAELIKNASLEATPKQIASLGDEKPDWLADGMRVYVPFLPSAKFEDAFVACEILKKWGIEPVPHLPARAVPNEQALRLWLLALQALGVTQILLIAGDIDDPKGPFTDTLQLMELGLFQEFGIDGIGVAGHPEGHPIVSEAVLVDALKRKRDYALQHGLSLWVVTQFSFEQTVLEQWLEDHQTILEGIPVYLGLAGPTRLKNLLSYAAQCGVATSAKALTRNLNAARLLRPWTPDSLLKAMAEFQSERPESVLKGIHLFPFGGLKQSSEWLVKKA
ncbi:methylenetetrahydrofolate reductase [Grimontia marina]|uniref:Methylenetetrahydrofolate reductase n=1 Tax=Grimontia marina TaxID=646534 RepID=A0A128F1R7_9GAMM|nr:methylenetetrahydrofolate reductase [Grimontia marina]CZF80742.1 Methylenetetrahydrofolate reductase [Grimontia marina]